MDIASLGGTILSVVAVVFGIIITGLTAEQIIDIPSVFITFFGSLASVVISNPIDKTKRAWSLYKMIFSQTSYNPLKKIQEIVSFSEKARRDGLLALEDDMDKLDDPFMRKALQLIVDGTDPDVVRNVMEIDLSAMEARHSENRDWFAVLGDMGPAFGMIGTLIGLVGMLGNMGGDSAAIGRGMAAALITTLYGSLEANIIAIPVVNKLKARTAEEVVVKSIMLEGALSIQAGENPRIVEEKLSSYLDPKKRVELKQQQDEE